MMAERDFAIDRTTIYCWVRRSAPELEKRCRPHLKSCNDSWRVDETYIKIKKTWRYLYRAVDSQRNTLEFLLSPTRDAEAAKRFFITALGRPTCSVAQGSRDRAARRSADQEREAQSHQTDPARHQRGEECSLSQSHCRPQRSGVLPERVELRQVKYITTSSNKIIGSSNGWSNQDWASSRLKRHGEHYRDTRR